MEAIYFTWNNTLISKIIFFVFFTDRVYDGVLTAKQSESLAGKKVMSFEEFEKSLDPNFYVGYIKKKRYWQSSVLPPLVIFVAKTKPAYSGRNTRRAIFFFYAFFFVCDEGAELSR